MPDATKESPCNEKTPNFLSTSPYGMVKTFCYDLLSFISFLLFLIICYMVVLPLKILGRDRAVNRMISFFEYFAR